MQNQRTSMNDKNKISKKKTQFNKSDVKKVNEKNHNVRKNTTTKNSTAKKSNVKNNAVKNDSVKKSAVEKGAVKNSTEKNRVVRKSDEKNRVSKEKDGMCPYAKNCGGCDYQGISYEKQLQEKQRMVEKLLKPFGKVEPILGMDEPLHYRHKVHAVFDCTKRGQIVAGVYKKNTHEVVDIEGCQIEDAEADAIILEIKALLKSFRIKAYNEDTGYGLLRHVLIRKGYHTGQIMVVLVLVSPILPSKNNFVKALRKKFPQISTVVVNVNDKRTSMVLGERNITIYGKGYIEDELCGCTFRISPNSFYQVNPKQTELLYNKAIEYAGLTGTERVFDAYCGTGTIGIIASQKAGQVIGVELNKDAVRDAITNAKRNDVHNIRFYNEDAGRFMVEMAEQKEKVDVVIMDPPRTGSDEAFLSSLVKLAPEKVVYVSCGPESLARDLKYLTKHGYQMEGAMPFDLFPFTVHVETVCLLSKLHEAKHHVNVTLDMDEMDLTAAESKATYEEIKKYVAEHNDGMKVSNLYIAQVKRKCGIEVGENFNLPKSEDSRQPQCPKEKENAIVEALKAFKMV